MTCSAEDLSDFLSFLDRICSFVGTPAELTEAAEHAALAAGEENILYSELILNPTHWPQFTAAEIIAAVTAGFDRAAERGGADCRFTLSLSRTQTGGRGDGTGGDYAGLPDAPAGWSLHRRERGPGGPDRGERFRPAFLAAKAAGFGCTVHAGESSGPEGVRDALDLLRADRLDHGVRAAEDPALVGRLVREQVPLNICLTSNLALLYRIRGEHPLRRLLDAGAAVTPEPGRPHLPGWADADGGAARGSGICPHEPGGTDPLSGDGGGRRLLRTGEQGTPAAGPGGVPAELTGAPERGLPHRMGWTPDRRPVYHLEETREFLCVSVKPMSTKPILPYQSEESCP